MERLEHFVILMDDRTSYKASVSETRRQCLHRKVEHMMLSHQPGRPCYGTQTELLIKLVTVRAKHLHQAQIYLHQGIGMDFQRGRIAAFLDDASRCDQVVQRATSPWVQAWV